LGEPGRLLEARVGVAPRLAAQLGQGDDGAAATFELVVGSVEDAQSSGSSSSAPIRLTGCSGCTVETACL
jgi:hypothetical protein